MEIEYVVRHKLSNLRGVVLNGITLSNFQNKVDVLFFTGNQHSFSIDDLEMLEGLDALVPAGFMGSWQRLEHKLEHKSKLLDHHIYLPVAICGNLVCLQHHDEPDIYGEKNEWYSFEYVKEYFKFAEGEQSPPVKVEPEKIEEPNKIDGENWHYYWNQEVYWYNEFNSKIKKVIIVGCNEDEKGNKWYLTRDSDCKNEFPEAGNCTSIKKLYIDDPTDWMKQEGIISG